MRIAHLVWSGAIGGTENFVGCLADQQAGVHNVSIFFMSTRANREFTNENICIHEFNMRSGYDVGAFVRVLRSIREFAPEIIHIHNATPLAMWAGLAAPRAATLHHVHTARRFGTLQSLIQVPFFRMSSGRIDLFIANSFSTKNHMVHNWKVPGERIVVVPNGIDVAHFSTYQGREAARELLGIDAKACVIGFVGRLQYVKGADLFLQVAAAVRPMHGHVIFVIVGDGPERRALQEQARSLDIWQYVHFLGERKDVAELLPAFDVFLSTSRVETFGIAILEAMAARVPVVAFATDAVPELVADCGVLVSTGDVHAAAKGVVELLKDPERRKQYADAAYERAKTHYSIQKISSQLDEIYTRTLNLRQQATRDTF